MGASTSAENPASVIMLGLDGAGKTTILKRLREIENEDTSPTIGIDLKELEPIDGITFHVFDFCGLPKMRPVWQSRLEEMDLEGLIYVVDISDEGRIPESREELLKVLSNEKMIQIPLLVIANKKSQNTIDDTKLIYYMGLENRSVELFDFHTVNAIRDTYTEILKPMQSLADMVKSLRKRAQ
ncbi:ADP-ribosylation factor-like protein 11 [Crassostrea angulata]|uniref:Uncharacterized protein n=1 Tax=Magallana gigas TaxID=29159 RepID=A0A8W8JJ56_MAGGI|nr:ADP-ribosylation factor-like protein 11 [Crassostrea gigas]XP_052711570.1 ADP-ribosylation factor-like protein 11 [Crassostrea angulata]